MSDAEEDLAKKYTRQLAASMQQLRDAAVLTIWGALDELYETVEPPTDEEEIK